MQFEANKSFASNSNAQSFLLFAGDGDDGGTLTPQSLGGAGANWAFNGLVVPPEAGGKKDFVELKERLQSELEKRGVEDRSKSVDVTREGQDRAARANARAKEPARQEAAPDDATVRYDENRNNAVLNDELRRVQTVHRQLGAEAGADPSAGLPARPADLAEPTEIETHAGLMGVDVPLPSEGRVFWFVSARAGSALSIDASPEGISPWLRALLSVALAAGLCFALVRLHGHRARKARID